MSLNLQSNSLNWDTIGRRPSYPFGWDWFMGTNWDEKKFRDIWEKLFSFCREQTLQVLTFFRDEFVLKKTVFFLDIYNSLFFSK